MAVGEFESQKAMKQCIPDNAAKPIAVGHLENNSPSAFYLCEFRDMRVRRPTAPSLAAILARMHQTSKSPTGKFGFPVVTFKGYAPMNNAWCDRWEDWFLRQFRLDIQWEQYVRGPDPEMEQLVAEFSAKVIPRVLRPLQTGGRNINPSLCHADIEHGNIHIDLQTQEPIIFDPCCVYGHHECQSPPYNDLNLIHV